MITSEWPTPENPHWVPFLVREVQGVRDAGVEVDLLSLGDGLRPDNYARAALQLRRCVRRYRYDLLHAQWGQSALVGMFSAKLPLIVTFRGSDVNGIIASNGRQTLRGRMLRVISQVVARRAQEVIAVSAQIAGKLPRNDIHVIPTGIDLELFRPVPKLEARRALNLSAEATYVLFAGRRSNPIKRYPLARAAVSDLDGVELLVAEGVLPDRMPLYMNAADALLLTSSREGSPNVVKEALACNLPVVSVNVGDVAARLNDIDGCAVCEDDDVETISGHLHHVLQNSRPIAGRAHVEAIDLRATASKIISVYQLALSKNN